jgi:hypothetical protein
MIIEIDALAPGDDEKVLLPETLHLGEGMPEMVAVPARESIVIHSHVFPLLLQPGKLKLL